MSDERPEVRNTAVRTLFLVVSSQGSRLSDAAWEEVLWQLLYPLLRSVHHMAATSSREEVSNLERQKSSDANKASHRFMPDNNLSGILQTTCHLCCIVLWRAVESTHWCKPEQTI